MYIYAIAETSLGLLPPPHKCTHAPTHTHSPTYYSIPEPLNTNTKLCYYLTFQRCHNTQTHQHTLKHTQFKWLHFILKMSNQQIKSSNPLVPFFVSFTPSLCPSLFPTLHFFPTSISPSVQSPHHPHPLLFLSWHVRLFLRNSCECVADLYNRRKNPPPSVASMTLLQDTDFNNRPNTEKALNISHPSF